MPDLWVWMDKFSDSVRSFMNPLLEVLQSEPVVEKIGRASCRERV